MDGLGNVFLGFAIVALGATIAGYWLLTRRGQRTTVWAIAVMLYVASYAIDPGRSRELHGLVGLVRMMGFIGILFGIATQVSRVRLGYRTKSKMKSDV